MHDSEGVINRLSIVPNVIKEVDTISTTLIGDSPCATSNCGLVMYHDKIHLLSGTNHYAYNGNSWTSVSTLPYSVGNGACVVFDDKIHIIGGEGKDNEEYNQYKHYAWNETGWVKVSNLLDYELSHFRGGGVVYNNKLHINGSFGHFAWNGTIWEKIDTIRNIYDSCSAVLNENIIYINKDLSPYIFKYDGVSWKDIGGFVIDEYGHFSSPSAIVVDNCLYVTESGSYMYIYDNNKWTYFPLNPGTDAGSINVARLIFYNGKFHAITTNRINFSTIEYKHYSLDINFKEYQKFILPKKDILIYSDSEITSDDITKIGENVYKTTTKNSNIEINCKVNEYLSIYDPEGYLLYAKPKIKDNINCYYLTVGTIVNDVPITTEGLTEIELPAVITYKNIPEHDHAFIESGSNHVCSICGSSEEHTFSEDFTVDTEPTCSNTGSKSNHCTKCTAKTNVTEISVIPHNYTSAITKEAACEEEGITTFTCSSCGNSYEETIPALGHDYSTEFTIDIQPTCNSVGSKSKHCSRCDAKTEVTEIPITEHNYVGTITKQATCTETGLMTFTCSMCNDTYEEVIPALGHNYVNGTCINCGDTKIIAPASETANWDYTLDEENKKIILKQYIGNATEVTVYEAYIVNRNIYNTELASNQNSSKSYMFYEKLDITSIKFNPGIDTRNTTSMEYMFYHCEALKNIDVSHLDTSNTTNMRGMFLQCSSLQCLDLTNFNTRNVTTMEGMFNNCQSLVNLKIENFITDNVTNMAYMFQGCYAIKNINLYNFNTSKVTNMACMFLYCESINDINLSNFDTNKVTNMNSMFDFSEALTTLDLTSFNTYNVKHMGRMFAACTKLTSIYASASDWHNATYRTDMFRGCGCQSITLI